MILSRPFFVRAEVEIFLILTIFYLFLGVTIEIFNKQIPLFETLNQFLVKFSYFYQREKA
jgi:hypothetical protein